MDKKRYKELFQELAKQGEMEPPASVRIGETGSQLVLVVRPSLFSRLLLPVLWGGVTAAAVYTLVSGTELLPFGRELLPTGLTDWAGWVVPVLWFCFGIGAIFSLFEALTITIDRQFVRISRDPFGSLRTRKVPLLDVRVVDIEAIAKEETREEDGYRRTVTTYTFAVTLSRTSDYRPVLVYKGRDEQLATFLRHYLGRQIAKRRAAPDITVHERYR